jgi:hypothetical protein
MGDFQHFVDNPGDRDFYVRDVLTDEMFEQLKSDMEKHGFCEYIYVYASRSDAKRSMTSCAKFKGNVRAQMYDRTMRLVELEMHLGECPAITENACICIELA